MNIANKLTVSRIILTFVFMFFLLYFEGLWARSLSLLFFMIAAISDFFDGKIAKKKNMVTDFGKLMDPIADKVLVLAALVALVQMQLVNSFMVMLIILREIAITSLRIFALNKGKVLSASRAGKHKTISQMLVIFFILCFIVFKEAMLRFFTWDPNWEGFFQQGIDVAMLLIVILTLYSGFTYLWENRKVIADI
ncbi:CDP-diacylglycerol--glycerol-3-phosphate 3-phosphatidyltransferase [Candidatus Omnitrophota bacterium]